MRRGTTPTFYLYVKSADLSGKVTWVTILQGGKQIDIETPQCEKTEEGCTLSFTLTQEQTLSLKPGDAAIQIRFIDNTGRAAATKIKGFKIKPILKEGEIFYE